MYIFAHRKARGMLEGEYASAFRGRSLDFDDLRAYVPGDEVRDIDWKATARTGVPLIKRYVATRRQQVLFVVDTGKNMAAVAHGGEVKKNIAVTVMGVIGSLALNHGDQVALVHGDCRSTELLPAQGTESHLERLLRRIDDSAVLEVSGSELSAQLEYASAHIKRRMFVVVIADEAVVDARFAKVLRRLAAQHEILWVQIKDAELAGQNALSGASYEVNGLAAVLTELANDSELADDYLRAVEARSLELSSQLRARGIAMTQIGHTDQVVDRVFALLEMHRRAH